MVATRRKKTAPKNLDSRLDALRSDMDALQTDVKGLGHGFRRDRE